MARRQAVSRSQVAAAMETLIAEGREPSTRAVRELIGHGSNTTIAEHIAAVKAGAATPERQLEALPEQLEAPLRQMLAVMGELADNRTTQAREALESRQREIEARWGGLVLEKESALQSLEAEQRVTAELRLRLADETRKLESAQSELGEWRERAVKAEASNGQLEKRLSDSSKQLNETRAQLDNLERATEVQRQREADAHNGRVAQMQQVIDAGHANELRLTEALGQSEREREKLGSAMRETALKMAAAETKQAELQELVAEMSIGQAESTKREARLAAQLSEALAARDVMSERLNTLQASLIAAQERIEQVRESATAESRSFIINLVDHSRRVFAYAQGVVKKSDKDFQELAIAQREIERLFATP